MNWVIAHIGMVLGSMGGVFVLGLAAKMIPGIVGKQVAVALNDVLAHLTLPEDKAAFKAIVASVDVRFPGMGNAKYALMVDDIIKKVPQLAASRQSLLDLLMGIGNAVKADLDAMK